jgi:uncharacterized membrane protein YfhO
MLSLFGRSQQIIHAGESCFFAYDINIEENPNTLAQNVTASFKQIETIRNCIYFNNQANKKKMNMNRNIAMLQKKYNNNFNSFGETKESVASLTLDFSSTYSQQQKQNENNFKDDESRCELIKKDFDRNKTYINLKSGSDGSTVPAFAVVDQNTCRDPKVRLFLEKW